MNSSNRVQFLIRFGYLGHLFHGVQPQKNVPTAGGALYELLLQAAKTPPRSLQFSARTDKGVHALMNAATCWFKVPFDSEQFIKTLSHIKTIGLLAVRAKIVPRFVHARGSAKGKHYRYVIEDNCQNTSPNIFAWQIVPWLNIDLMQQAANQLLGEHDFTSFRAAGCSANTTTKNMYRIDICRISNSSQIHVDIIGDAFLRQMIRTMVGLLAEVGTGLRAPAEMTSILAAKDRKQAGMCAPANGLTLMQVGIDFPQGENPLLPFFKKKP